MPRKPTTTNPEPNHITAVVTRCCQKEEEYRHEQRKDMIWDRLVQKIGREVESAEARNPCFRMMVFTVPEVTTKFGVDSTSREAWAAFRRAVAEERRWHMKAMGWPS